MSSLARLSRPLLVALILPACSDDGAAPADTSTSAATTSTATSDDPSTTTADVPTTTPEGDTTALPDPATTDPDPGTTSTTDTTDPTTTDATTTADPDPAGSRCDETPTTITCPKQTLELGPWQRDVHWQVPLGDPPASGWPVVLMFQGSLFSAELTWIATDDLPFGAFHQTRVVKALLDHGFAVITPETKLDGGTFWDTNIPPYSLNWESSEDHELMLALFAAIDDGTFGELDPARLFATGVSSGGYMSSRMAIAYPGKFRSLAIAAASYATCSGPLCDVPALPADHPPTLLLHGELDATVPLYTAEAYHDELLATGIATQLVTDPLEGHGWIPASPDEVLTWFQTHP
jgi:poly(3-hydroxybutyrate) depolymerase